MAFLKRSERWLILLALLTSVSLVPQRAHAQAFWTSDFDVSEGDVNDTFTPLNNQRCAVVDDSNNLYIAFFDNRNKAGLDNNFEIYFRRFVYNFGSPNLTRVTNFYNPSKYPSLATLNWGQGDAATVQDSGRIYIAWQDSRLYSIPPTGEPKSYNIFFRTFQSQGGLGFGPEFQVSEYDSIDAATAPVVTVGDSSRVWIVYPKSKSNNTDEDLYYAVYNSATRTMGAVQPLEVDPSFRSALPSVAATRDGVVNVVWADTRNGAKLQLFWKQFIPGSGWTAAQQIVFTGGTSIATNPSLTADWHGHLHLVWRDNRDGNNEIYYKEYVPGTGWDAVDTRLTVNNSAQIEPQVDADPMSNAYVVWTDSRNGSSNPDIFYKERKGGTWAAEVPLVYAATDTTNSVQHFPAITHDGVGSTYVMWTDERFPASIGKNKEVFYKIGFGVTTGVEATPRASVARLLRNYPNPFNPATKVDFTLVRDAQATLRVYDASGRLVRTLLNSYLAAGRHQVNWDGKDDLGRGAVSGVYFLRLQAAGQFLSRTVNLVK